jgi:uncharacterized membrane protein
MEIFELEGWALLARWAHFLAGITWIGLLYYFNFVQTPFFAEIEADVRTTAIRKLVPRALAWFRYSAALTVAAGITIISIRFEEAGNALWSSSYGVSILTGMSLGFLMFLNVWGVIWPNQKVLIRSAEGVAAGGPALPEVTAAGRRALLASRTNVLFSIPMLFFMATAAHLPLFADAASVGELAIYWILATVVILAVEANSIQGGTGPTVKPLESIETTIAAGFGLWLVLYVLIQAITRS